jgi:uncharacterized protein YkwD
LFGWLAENLATPLAQVRTLLAHARGNTFHTRNFRCTKPKNVTGAETALIVLRKRVTRCWQHCQTKSQTRCDPQITNCEQINWHLVSPELTDVAVATRRLAVLESSVMVSIRASTLQDSQPQVHRNFAPTTQLPRSAARRAFEDQAPGFPGDSSARAHCDSRRKNDTSRQTYWSRTRSCMKSHFAILLSLALLFGGLAAAEASPAEMISGFRLKHGEGRVVLDATLNRIALEQARAMAARDKLDHDVLGSFGSRIAPSKAGRAAENIAYGYDSFEKTLDQWITSSEHRKNLLLPKASRVGVASATSATSHRTYWAMEIAGDYEPPPRLVAAGRKMPPAAKPKASVQSCRVKLLGLCL